VDTEQRTDASDVKTHEEILLLLKELDSIEKRVKNLRLSEEPYNDANAVQQEVEITEPSVETIQEPQPEQPDDIIHRNAHKVQNRVSLLDFYKKQRATKIKTKRRVFSNEGDHAPLLLPAEPEVHQYAKRRRKKEKPIQSTFKLYITEEGTLAGLDIMKPKPPKAQDGLFRRHTTGTNDHPQDAQEPGFKGKLKRLVKKINPRSSKKGEAGNGIGNRLKGIVKRRPKEQK
jgi:hypothetical protein